MIDLIGVLKTVMHYVIVLYCIDRTKKSLLRNIKINFLR